jgi:hypothetical protein
VGYGCPADRSLSDSDKLRNADNYNVSEPPSFGLRTSTRLGC